MKNIITLSFFLCLFHSYAQNISGDWNGTLALNGMELSLIFHLEKQADEYTATMDSPDQNATGIPVEEVDFSEGKLTLNISNLGAIYKGKLNKKEHVFEGEFTQNGMTFPLQLKKGKLQEKQRPQEPKKPYKYRTKEVSFTNTKDQVTLSGTLTLPEKKGVYPAVALISGSGPQDRNEEIMGHKPFLVIADYLTKNGIAVLRYDDRGVGESTGNFERSTSQDFANDAKAAFDYLKTQEEIDPENIGLVGHSEGGMIAPMIAAEETSVAFIVLLAGVGLPGDQLLLKQQELIWRASDINKDDIEEGLAINKEIFKIIKTSNPKRLKSELKAYLNEVITASDIPEGESKEAEIEAQLKQVTNPWALLFLRYDPRTILEKVSCPVLAVNGEKDLQVPPKENLNAIKSALENGGNTKVTTKEYPDLNHLFQEAETGLPAEYGKIEETFSEQVLEDMTQWILGQL